MLSHELNYIVYGASRVHKLLINNINEHFIMFERELSLKNASVERAL